MELNSLKDQIKGGQEALKTAFKALLLGHLCVGLIISPVMTPVAYALKLQLSQDLRLRVEGESHMENVGLLKAGSVIEIPDQYVVRRKGKFDQEATLNKWLKEAGSSTEGDAAPGLRNFDSKRRDYYYPVQVVKAAKGSTFKEEHQDGATYFLALRYLARQGNKLHVVQDAPLNKKVKPEQRDASSATDSAQAQSPHEQSQGKRQATGSTAREDRKQAKPAVSSGSTAAAPAEVAAAASAQASAPAAAAAPASGASAATGSTAVREGAAPAAVSIKPSAPRAGSPKNPKAILEGRGQQTASTGAAAASGVTVTPAQAGSTNQEAKPSRRTPVAAPAPALAHGRPVPAAAEQAPEEAQVETGAAAAAAPASAAASAQPAVQASLEAAVPGAGTGCTTCGQETAVPGSQSNAFKELTAALQPAISKDLAAKSAQDRSRTLDDTKKLEKRFLDTCGFNLDKFIPVVKQQAESEGVPADLLMSLMVQESSGDCTKQRREKSKSGKVTYNIGLFQINTGSKSVDIPRCDIDQLTKIRQTDGVNLQKAPRCLENPYYNLREAIRILKSKATEITRETYRISKNESYAGFDGAKFKDKPEDLFRLAVSAYNGGERWVLRAKQDLETFNKVHNLSGSEKLNPYNWEDLRVFYLRNYLDRTKGGETQHFESNVAGRADKFALSNLAYTENVVPRAPEKRKGEPETIADYWRRRLN